MEPFHPLIQIRVWMRALLVVPLISCADGTAPGYHRKARDNSLARLCSGARAYMFMVVLTLA